MNEVTLSLSEVILLFLACVSLPYIVVFIRSVPVAIANAYIFNILIGYRPKKKRHYFTAMVSKAVKRWCEGGCLDITTECNGWVYNPNWWFLKRSKNYKG